MQEISATRLSTSIIKCSTKDEILGGANFLHFLQCNARNQVTSKPKLISLNFAL